MAILSRFLLLAGIPLCTMAGDLQLTAADFDDALQYAERDLAALVRNASIEPHWMKDGKHFWYRRSTADGQVIVVVNAESGETTEFGDEDGLKDEFGALLEADVAEQPAPELLPGPAGKRALLVRDYNLWLRDLANGSEEALTDDGEAYAAYASPPDQQSFGRGQSPSDNVTRPVATHWSPGGRWIITRQIDERNVQSYPFFEAAPADRSFRPRVHDVKVALLGDEHRPVIRDIIIDLEAGSSYPIRLPPGFDLEDAYPANSPLGWQGGKAFIYASTANARTGRLLEVDLASGQSRTIIEERAPGSRVNISLTFGRDPLVHILDNEVVWYSERSGYGHLYLYDLASGKLKRQLTQGRRIVASILHVDRDRRSLLVTMGRGADADPYQRYVYRISLDGADAVLITPETAHHEVRRGGVSPAGDFFVDTYSTVSLPPRSVLRRVWAEDEVTVLEDAAIEALAGTGWQPPHRIRVKAADGTTDLYAVLFEPYGDSAEPAKLPVIDFNYINSIASIAPVGFMDAFGVFHVESLRRLGFYVVVVDGRGTPNRSRQFREAGYPVFYDLQVEDHASAIQQLAERFDAMDIERVGIWGSSNGGAGAVRALLQRPDFFKVAVASAGSHDYMSLPPSGVKYFGVPEYADGSTVRPAPDAVPANYLGFDNAALVDNLRGHLLLAYGDMDTYALPATTLRLVNALIEAGKTFDVLPMLNHGHFFLYEPYFKRRLIAYFVEHLQGVDVSVN